MGDQHCLCPTDRVDGGLKWSRIKESSRNIWNCSATGLSVTLLAQKLEIQDWAVGGLIGMIKEIGESRKSTMYHIACETFLGNKEERNTKCSSFSVW